MPEHSVGTEGVARRVGGGGVLLFLQHLLHLRRSQVN